MNRRLLVLAPVLALLAACASPPARAPASVEEATVQQADILATNGVVHKVDRVLMPPRR